MSPLLDTAAAQRQTGPVESLQCGPGTTTSGSARRCDAHDDAVMLSMAADPRVAVPDGRRPALTSPDGALLGEA
jgi:hypothetical protein